ncbi:MAG TPA: ATP-dependent helicase [Anaerolineaceae bacterium]|nr:ATP-dependent helicase [Anaerolineaceae bacterium]
MFKPRPMQAEILKYQGGKMGVAAVPGSGKTATLSALAAQLITKGSIYDDQEILIVTLVNSAVDNFSTRIGSFVREAGLLENMGYRVRTLHGLAHDIVRERPDLAGLSEQFSILDENESSRMIEAAAAAYLREHPELAELFVDPTIDLHNEPQTQKNWNETVTGICANFISQAKDLQIEPTELREKMEKHHLTDPLLEMAVQVYFEYQRGLRYRGSVDFSDLVRLAHRVLSSDPEFLERLRYRWPYILEDEAQDSSLVQERILRLLVGPDGNWVRVGDTNQAIYETFTTASPTFLRDFLREPGVAAKDLANSGRSNKSIIRLANDLNKWTRDAHPVEELRSSLSLPSIIPAPPGDPQPNPPDHPQSIYIMKNAVDSEEEIKKVVESIKNWLPNNQNKTAAVLCPIGFHAEKVVEALQIAGIEIVEMLKSTQSTRRVTRILEKVLVCLSDPSAVNKLVAVFQLLTQDDSDLERYKSEVSNLLNQLKKVRELEVLLYADNRNDWHKILQREALPPELDQKLSKFLNDMIRWQNAAPLPVDQLLLTIGRDLFTSPQDLALTHKLALLLEFSARNHPEYQLPQFAIDLAEIASNERKFTGFSEDDTGFNPEAHKGKVLVSTFHKAKGLEWDRVYLMSVNNYDFPSAQEFDNYKGEKWFIAHHLNLEAELLDKLKAIVNDDIPGMFMEAGYATRQARLEYSSERLRLLYVGITRARESLIITWNTGRRKEARMALPLEALHAILEEKNAAS